MKIISMGRGRMAYE